MVRVDVVCHLLLRARLSYCHLKLQRPNHLHYFFNIFLYINTIYTLIFSVFSFISLYYLQRDISKISVVNFIQSVEIEARKEVRVLVSFLARCLNVYSQRSRATNWEKYIHIHKCTYTCIYIDLCIKLPILVKKVQCIVFYSFFFILEYIFNFILFSFFLFSFRK